MKLRKIPLSLSSQDGKLDYNRSYSFWIDYGVSRVHKFLQKTKGLDFCFVEFRLTSNDIELKTFTLKIKGKLSERG